MGDIASTTSKAKKVVPFIGPETAMISAGTREMAKGAGYTTTQEKKSAASEKAASEAAAIEQEKKAAKLKDEDIRRRTAIFQSIGGSVAVGGRKTIYGN